MMLEMALFVGLSTCALDALQHKKNGQEEERNVPVWTDNHTTLEDQSFD